jgi:hypothetical protein
MSPITNPTLNRSGTACLRSARGMAVMFVMIAYLLAGALHGLCDLDVTNAIGNSRVSMTSGKDLGQTDKGTVAEHHCHGCFSVSVSAAQASQKNPHSR